MANGAGRDRELHGEERCWKRPKELIRPGRRLKLMPRIEWDWEFLWKLYVPQRNDGTIYIYIYIYIYIHTHTHTQTCPVAYALWIFEDINGLLICNYRISRPIRRTFFSPKKWLNSTCVLCAEGIISKLINTRTRIEWKQPWRWF